ncbi:hypothetical protein DL769_005809 [Monosporascus sp. CRB-8-3]|nr:hypothetical protein DL769_005809 [Monosporascus sp. CRB-8-3]
MDKFNGPIYHSNQLTGHRSAANAVEALEYAVDDGAKTKYSLSRSDKWVISRNATIDIPLSFNTLGQETTLSWTAEKLPKKFFYRTSKTSRRTTRVAPPHQELRYNAKFRFDIMQTPPTPMQALK